MLLRSRFALFMCLVFSSLSVLSTWTVRAAPSPNIVFILIDDLGWRDVGCYGNRFVETPNIDQLAAEGMRFTDFYAAGTVCSPTRASIQSGQNQARIGLTDFIPGHWRPFERVTTPQTALRLPLEIETIAEALSAADYRTGYFGKWHLSWAGKGEPSEQGYDESIVTSGRHFAPGFRVQPKTAPRPKKGEYLSDYLTDRTCDFIRANKDRRFFAFLSHYAVHIPLQARHALVEKYRQRAGEEGYPNNPIYAAMIEHTDRSVATILATLKELSLDENTLLVFTSDNGGLHKRFGGGDPVAVTSNAPLRGEKGMIYEGGIRVPMIARWPGVIPAASTCKRPAVSHDFYPTFLELAGARPPTEQVIDGQSFAKLLREPDATAHRDSIYFHYPHYHHSRPASALRRGDWKLIEFLDDASIELYKLSEDIGEQRNLAVSQPALAERLRHDLDAWRRSIDAAMPTANPSFRPQRRHEWWSRRNRERIDSEKLAEGLDSVDYDPSRPANLLER